MVAHTSKKCPKVKPKLRIYSQKLKKRKKKERIKWDQPLDQAMAMAAHNHHINMQLLSHRANHIPRITMLYSRLHLNLVPPNVIIFNELT
jgi:hypothetical protein